ncbi:MAG: TIGR03943 family protein [Spirochaetales bacterium]|uniref:TIGR03943 family protein n=1 Tax=Candidatus Thalassospirochaeta sargassi TaxID=3119039 RepID=A0AAJ1MI82_9SPIO|nr:TIGR03943 family protein [Spirochaetales bacterium]
MKRIVMWLEFIVQGLWLIFLIFLVIENDGRQLASDFLNPKYFWLLYLSIVFFAFFLFNTLIKILSGSDGDRGVPVFLYLIVPLVLLPVSLKAELGSAAVTRRGVVFHEVQKSEPVAEAPKTLISPFTGTAPSYKNADGTDRFLEILSNPEESIGRSVDIIGQAAFNPLLPEGSFYIFRFIIYCCAADATPSGLIVTGIESSQVEADHWYRIKGTVTMTPVDGKEYLSVDSDSIEQIEEPEMPFESY